MLIVKNKQEHIVLTNERAKSRTDRTNNILARTMKQMRAVYNSMSIFVWANAQQLDLAILTKSPDFAIANRRKIKQL